MLGDRFATVDSADSSTYRYIKEIVGSKEDQEEYGTSSDDVQLVSLVKLHSEIVVVKRVRDDIKSCEKISILN